MRWPVPAVVLLRAAIVVPGSVAAGGGKKRMLNTYDLTLPGAGAA